MSFVNERAVKAVRKAAQCCACLKQVEVGEPAIRWAGVSDGDFSSVIYHPDCREAEIALNKLHGTLWDEWIAIWDLDWEDHRWLLETYPAVAERKGITLAEVEETEREREEASRAWAEIDRKRREDAAAALRARASLIEEERS